MKPIDAYIRQQQIEVRDSLNKAFDLGWDASEERIIKLLEGDAGQKIMCLDCSQELIALIKGGNNEQDE